MSYCVKCGVELDEGAERCPLCGTPAWKPDETEPRYFPTKPAEVPVSYTHLTLPTILLV